MDARQLSLAGQVAVVTGGSRGIGRATVELLAKLGANVVVNYARNEAAAETAAALVTSTGREGIAVKADVATLSGAEDLIRATIARFQRLDILICNAGIWEGAPIEKLTEDIWDRTMAINLKGVWSVCHAAVPIFKRQRSGKIVIVTSTAGQRGEANYSNYAASKGGLIAFTKSLASELGAFGINVNAVAPGWVDTDMTADGLGNKERREKIAAEIPIGAIATPDDIAASIVFLCSEWARHITGEVLNVNGGAVLCG